MNQVAGDRAIARSGEAYRQAGRSCGADIEIRVAKRLVRQRSKRDRLIRLRDREGARKIWRGVVVLVAALRSIDLAGAGPGEMNQRAAHRAVADGDQGHDQPRAGCGEDIEIRIPKRLIRNRVQRNKLVSL